MSRKPKLSAPAGAAAVEKDAVTLIVEAGEEPSLDELGRRARRALAAQADATQEDKEAIARFFREQRAAWGSRDLEKKEEKDEEAAE